MAKRINRLSVKTVAAANRPGLYSDGGNLFLKVGESGSKSWIVRWVVGGRVRKHGIGAVRTVTLADAREKAADIRRLLRDGIDPRDVRRADQAAAAIAEAKRITFDAATDAYIEAHRAGWKSAKHAAQWKATLSTYASPVFGKLPVAAIDVGLVMRVLRPIWTSKNETAHRLRGRIEAVLSWSKVYGYRSGENPAQWRGHLDHLLPARGKVHKVTHHAALPYDQLPAFMRDLRGRDGIAARALELTILCAVRTAKR